MTNHEDAFRGMRLPMQQFHLHTHGISDLTLGTIGSTILPDLHKGCHKREERAAKERDERARQLLRDE